MSETKKAPVPIEASEYDSIQLAFRTIEEREFYSKIVLAAKEDNRKPSGFLLRAIMGKEDLPK